jgi:flagellar motor protein MotB
LYTRGLASEKPVADNRTAGGRQKNRRVEIYIYVRE